MHLIFALIILIGLACRQVLDNTWNQGLLHGHGVPILAENVEDPHSPFHDVRFTIEGLSAPNLLQIQLEGEEGYRLYSSRAPVEWNLDEFREGYLYRFDSLGRPVLAGVCI